MATKRFGARNGTPGRPTLRAFWSGEAREEKYSRGDDETRNNDPLILAIDRLKTEYNAYIKARFCKHAGAYLHKRF